MRYSVFRNTITSLFGSKTSSVDMCMQNSVLTTRITSLYRSQHSSVVLHAKQRLLDQNYKSLWVPALICGFCMRNSDFMTRITTLHWAQASPVISCSQNIVIRTRILVSIGPSPHMWFCAYKTASL